MNKMKEIITTIKREKGFIYKVDKEGNVIKGDYNWFKDPYTLITISIIILSLLYYLQISNMKTIEKNFEQSCLKYIEARNEWMNEHPGQIPTLKQVMDYIKENERKRYG